MLNRLSRILLKGSAVVSLGVAAFSFAQPAQAGPLCLPYILDDGRIVRLCRQPAAADEHTNGIRGSGR